MIRLLIGLLVPLGLLTIVEYTVINFLWQSSLWGSAWGYLYMIVAILGYICGLLALYLKGRSAMRRPITNLLIGVCFASFVQKLAFVLSLIHISEPTRPY